MTVSDVLSAPASPIKSPIGSPGASPNPTQELPEIVSVALAALPRKLEATGPSLPEKKRNITREKKDSEDLKAREPVESMKAQIVKEVGRATEGPEAAEKKDLPVCEQSKDKITVENKDGASSASVEEKFVSERREEITKGLTAWNADYKPYPSFWLSFVPGISGIVQKECLVAVRTFMDEVKEAQTRRKLCSVLERNRVILTENECFMDTSTAEKAHAACELIDGELARLRAFGPLPSKVAGNGAKQEKTLQPNDPLYSVKLPLWEKLDGWKKDFVPTPAGLLNFIPGVASKLKDITDRLCGDLFRDIRKAQSIASLAGRLKIHQELLRAYTAFVDAATVAKMEAACNLLEEGSKELSAT
jgi:hypothetical protein